MRRFLYVPLILLVLLIVPAACSEDGAGSNLSGDAVADVPVVLEYRFDR
jgi:hypothetical protein